MGKIYCTECGAELDDAVTSGTEVEQYQYIGLRK